MQKALLTVISHLKLSVIFHMPVNLKVISEALFVQLKSKSLINLHGLQWTANSYCKVIPHLRGSVQNILIVFPFQLSAGVTNKLPICWLWDRWNWTFKLCEWIWGLILASSQKILILVMSVCMFITRNESINQVENNQRQHSPQIKSFPECFICAVKLFYCPCPINRETRENANPEQPTSTPYSSVSLISFRSRFVEQKHEEPDIDQGKGSKDKAPMATWVVFN